MISVATITYNNFIELKASLDSIRNAQNIESVVINGGDSIDSFSLLSQHQGTVVNESDDGISDAFNKGFRYSKGQAVTYLNSGDLLLDPEYYLWADRVFTEDPSVGFVYSDIIFDDPILGKYFMKPRGRDASDLGAGMPFPHPSMIVRREIFEQIGGFSEDYKISMDFDFVVRLLGAGHRGLYYPHATVMMDGAGVSSTREIQGIMECKRSLESNGHFYGQIRRDFELRLLNYRIRTGIKRLLGNTGLKLIKTLKNKLK